MAAGGHAGRQRWRPHCLKRYRLFKYLPQITGFFPGCGESRYAVWPYAAASTQQTRNLLETARLHLRPLCWAWRRQGILRRHDQASGSTSPVAYTQAMTALLQGCCCRALSLLARMHATLHERPVGYRKSSKCLHLIFNFAHECCRISNLQGAERAKAVRPTQPDTADVLAAHAAVASAVRHGAAAAAALEAQLAPSQELADAQVRPETCTSHLQEIAEAAASSLTTPLGFPTRPAHGQVGLQGSN